MTPAEKIEQLEGQLQACNRARRDAEGRLAASREEASELHAFLVSRCDRLAPDITIDNREAGVFVVNLSRGGFASRVAALQWAERLAELVDRL